MTTATAKQTLTLSELLAKHGYTLEQFRRAYYGGGSESDPQDWIEEEIDEHLAKKVTVHDEPIGKIEYEAIASYNGVMLLRDQLVLGLCDEIEFIEDTSEYLWPYNVSLDSPDIRVRVNSDGTLSVVYLA